MKKAIKTNWNRLLTRDMRIIMSSLNQDGIISAFDLHNTNGLQTLEEEFGWIQYQEDYIGGYPPNGPEGYFSLTELGEQMCKIMYEE